MAGWFTFCIFFLLSVCFNCPSEMSEKVAAIMRIQCRIGAQPRCLVGGDRYFFCRARTFRTSAAIWCLSTNLVARSLSRSFYVRHWPKFICGHPRGRGLLAQHDKIFLGLGLMESGRRGVSIEEVYECYKCRRARWQYA
jgi:hypothetical protein